MFRVQLIEFLSDQNELAAADVLVFVREATQRFEPLRPVIIAKLLDTFPSIKSLKYGMFLENILDIFEGNNGSMLSACTVIFFHTIGFIVCKCMFTAVQDLSICNVDTRRILHHSWGYTECDDVNSAVPRRGYWFSDFHHNCYTVASQAVIWINVRESWWHISSSTLYVAMFNDVDTMCTRWALDQFAIPDATTVGIRTWFLK